MFQRHEHREFHDAFIQMFPELAAKHKDEKHPNIVKNFTFQVTEACSLACTYCLSGDTKIMMSDYTVKDISDIQVGDTILGFDEYPYDLDRAHIRKVMVLNTFHRRSNAIRVVFDNGVALNITPNHKVLRYFDDSFEYVEIGTLDTGDIMCQLSSNRDCLELITIASMETIPEEIDVYNIETESGTYIANGIAVHNCYQIAKTTKRMSFETAKKIVDRLYDDDNGKSEAIVLEFIGGEPLLEVELIDKIIDYFMMQGILRNHRWATYFMVSICSNGVAYFEPKVQDFIEKHHKHLSFSISIDGYKELHDACRIFPDGRGSYDVAVAGALSHMLNYNPNMSTKMTFAPENIRYVSEALKNLINLGYKQINANCIFEEGWTQEHSQIFYQELKKAADWMIENDKETVYLSLFEEYQFAPMDPKENSNFCWIAGTPILTADGYKPIEEIKIGDMVYTEDGTIHPVIRTMNHFADNVVEVSASGLFKLGCTDDHKLFAKPFDYIGWKYKKHYKDYGEYQVKDLKNKDLIKLFQLPEGEVDYNVNLAFLVGRYIGDGWSTKNDTEMGICCAFDEIEELTTAFEKANVNYRRHSAHTVEQFYIKRSEANEQTKELMRIIPLCGHSACGKHLPPECFNWSKLALKALLDGYMSADGCKKKGGSNAFNTVSYRLAQEMMVVLRTLGYTPTCYKNNRAGKGVILGREVNLHDRYEVYFYDDVNRSRYIQNVFGSMWTSNIKTKPIEPQMVYNFTVQDNHSYVAGGLVSRNCGGNGAMLSADPDGTFYPCIRYMPTSLGDSQPPITCGHMDTGIDWSTLECMQCITRRSQSTDECFNCPIASGCAWCTAYNYQRFGTIDKRATFICEMHKARSLANVYFWNKVYRKHNMPDRFEMHCPKDWALKIIDEQEYEMLKQLSEE